VDSGDAPASKTERTFVSKRSRLTEQSPGSGEAAVRPAKPVRTVTVQWADLVIGKQLKGRVVRFPVGAST
jgi:hypothetical protein